MSAGVSHEPSQEVQCVVTFYHTINIENINVSKNTYLLTLDLCTFSKCVCRWYMVTVICLQNKYAFIGLNRNENTKCKISFICCSMDNK